MVLLDNLLLLAVAVGLSHVGKKQGCACRNKVLAQLVRWSVVLVLALFAAFTVQDAVIAGRWGFWMLAASKGALAAVLLALIMLLLGRGLLGHKDC